MQRGKVFRIYVDTSVIGGCLDDEFRTPSIRLVHRARAGFVQLVVSDTTLAELAGAPPRVRSVLEDLPPGCVELVRQDSQSETLAEEYVQHGVIPERMLADALHIAAATIAKVDVLVSWNFKHIVNLDRIRGYNAVNLRLGHAMLETRSPLELWTDDDQDV